MQLLLVVGLSVAAALAQRTSTTIDHPDGTQTTVTCSGSQNVHCDIRDSTNDDRDLFRDEYLYCTKGLKMPKKQVLVKGTACGDIYCLVKEKKISPACEDAFEEKLMYGTSEADCRAAGKKFDRNTRECKH